MTNRIGRRTRHRRHKASTLDRKRQWIKRLVRSPIPSPPSRALPALMVGGPLDGERHYVDSRYLTVAIQPKLPPVAEFLSMAMQRFDVPDVRTVTYVRTREFAKSSYMGCRPNRVCLMQPQGDPPIGPDLKALPPAIRDRIEAILS